MTGATLIAFKGDKFALVKVRTDGSDVEELVQPLVSKGCDPVDVLKAYLDARAKHWGHDEPGGWKHQLDENRRRAVFEFTMPLPHPQSEDELYELADLKVDELIQEQLARGDTRFEGYECSYCDYAVIIDCEMGKSEVLG